MAVVPHMAWVNCRWALSWCPYCISVYLIPSIKLWAGIIRDHMMWSLCSFLLVYHELFGYTKLGFKLWCRLQWQSYLDIWCMFSHRTYSPDLLKLPQFFISFWVKITLCDVLHNWSRITDLSLVPTVFVILN